MSRHVVLYVLGPPGVGKTTLIRNLVPALKRDSFQTVTEVQSPKWTIAGGAAIAGHWRGTAFDGGDTVPYTGARAALEYWRDHLLPSLRACDGLTIFDGDRFSTQPSLDFIRATGEPVKGLHLIAKDDQLAARRAARGSNQNETWIRGRETKAKNFAVKVGSFVVDATRSPEEVMNLAGSFIEYSRREIAA